jgi:RNA polymerase sigma-70 factor (ECF subfamily)
MVTAEFQKFFAGLRARDEKAAEELVRQFEPVIRRVVRMRLTDARLRRVFDSMDICQSILAHFFAGAGQGAFELESPKQLLNLLVTMARNKVTDKARRERHHAGGLPEGREPAVATHPPGEAVARQELVEAIRSRLTAKERWLVDQHALGRGWAELARESGDSPSALRMMHARAITRVQKQLGDES